MTGVGLRISANSTKELDDLKQSIIESFEASDIWFYCADLWSTYDGKIEDKEQVDNESELLRAKELQEHIKQPINKDYLTKNTPAKIHGETIEQIADSIISYLKSGLCTYFSIFSNNIEKPKIIVYISDTIANPV